ncbi:MAG: hypothetical protein IRY90_04865 [Actinomadura rubrobrunea]|nr:hypothetical protein [Actinomadura rubrobrunea]
MRWGKAKKREEDEQRAKFLANRDKVRAWTEHWDCPEVQWPEFMDVPRPWIVAPGGEADWLRYHAPHMDEYWWLLEGRPVAQGLVQVLGIWWFGRNHEFDHLEIQFRSVLDPQYLAEKLALGAHAAALKGWHDSDAQKLYEWLLQGLETRPFGHGVSGKNRLGFVLCEFTRMPTGDSTVFTKLKMTLTTTALDGTPLDGEGRAIKGA